MKYIKKLYVRTSAYHDGYDLKDYSIVTEQGENSEKKIYYFVYENDFFEKFPVRCKVAFEKGKLSDDEYKAKCEDLGVIDSTPTDTVAEEITEKTIYIPYSDEEEAKANAEVIFRADLSLEDYKGWAKTLCRKNYEIINKKSPYTTTDGTVIDYGLNYIPQMQHLITLVADDEVIDFRCYDNKTVKATKQQLEKWLGELIAHSAALINIKWKFEEDIDNANSYVALKLLVKTAGDIWR